MAKHTGFTALAQGKVDHTVDVIPIADEERGTMMCVCSEEAAIYITKAQAMAFFNLEEKENTHA